MRAAVGRQWMEAICTTSLIAVCTSVGQKLTPPHSVRSRTSAASSVGTSPASDPKSNRAASSRASSPVPAIAPTATTMPNSARRSRSPSVKSARSAVVAYGPRTPV